MCWFEFKPIVIRQTRIKNHWKMFFSIVIAFSDYALCACIVEKDLVEANYCQKWDFCFQRVVQSTFLLILLQSVIVFGFIYVSNSTHTLCCLYIENSRLKGINTIFNYIRAFNLVFWYKRGDFSDGENHRDIAEENTCFLKQVC